MGSVNTRLWTGLALGGCALWLAAMALPGWLAAAGWPPVHTWQGQRVLALSGVAIGMAVLTWAHARGEPLASRLAPLLLCLLLPFVFMAGAFSGPVVPPGVWLPALLALTVARVRDALLTLALTLVLTLTSYPGAAAQPMDLLGGAVLLSLLALMRLRLAARLQQAERTAERAQAEVQALTTALADAGRTPAAAQAWTEATLPTAAATANAVTPPTPSPAPTASTDLLAGMSREIRTPLNTVIGQTHLLLRDAASAQQHAQLVQVDAAARHVMQLLGDVLDLSQLQAGRLQLEAHPFNTDMLVARCVGSVGTAARDKGLALRVDTAQLPPHLVGDAARLGQALGHLLRNAVQFTAQGAVTLSAKVLADDADGLLLRFEVHDTGAGIAPERLPQLFAPFAPVGSHPPPQAASHGLGLALTRQLAQRMGGDAGVASAVGEGSRFWFSARLQRPRADAPGAVAGANTPAPLRSPVRDADQALRALQARHAGRRVLLAEDHALNRELAVALLAHAGLRVDTATTGAQAVALCAAQPYDLVLMDIRMPEMDGQAATRAIRAQQGPGLPIVALTVHTLDEDRAACLAAGMNDHVPKPVEPAVLYAALLRWLPQRAGQAAPAGGVPTSFGLGGEAANGSVGPTP